MTILGNEQMRSVYQQLTGIPSKEIARRSFVPKSSEAKNIALQIAIAIRPDHCVEGPLRASLSINTTMAH